MDDLFKGLFDAEGVTGIGFANFMICIGVAIVCGLLLALCYIIRARYTRGFIATLALLPAVVAVVIMMVNGNLGAGVAVAGAFSLVRFRSAPGTAKEILAIFIAMGVGLVCGMGYIAYAILVSVIFGLLMALYNFVGGKANALQSKYKVLKIMIPEDLNYCEIFDSILSEYSTKYELVQVKTTNMGSMIRLTYDICLKSGSNEKEMIDKIRCKNGNLEIIISNQETNTIEL